MVVILAHITVVPGREAMFERAASELAALTMKHESGIRRYEYVRLAETGSYQATLAFEDYDAFLQHQASQHHAVIAGAMGDMIASLRLERVDPVPGCSELAPPTTAGEFEATTIEPVDDAVLVARTDHYRERYPLDPPTWWSAIR